MEVVYPLGLISQESLVRIQPPQPNIFSKAFEKLNNISGCSLVWFKAPALGAGDREFESHFPDHNL